MNDECLNRLLDTAWQQILDATTTRDHPARLPTFATISDGKPSLRTLVLRGASRSDLWLEFYTDAAAPKAREIKKNPNVAVHFWVPNVSLQIRASATAKLMPGDPALFKRLPEQAKANYTGPVPGDALADDHTETEPRFGQLVCHVTSLDILHLGETHTRALYVAEDGWIGSRIAP